tara:strand:- start:390 stop:671 length:282 start_codon:yes stop_codon:yes gene_type:complete
MNKLSIHGITEITIEREIIPRDASYMNPNEFTVIHVTAKDRNGTRTRLTCFVEPEYTIEPDTIFRTVTHEPTPEDNAVSAFTEIADIIQKEAS